MASAVKTPPAVTLSSEQLNLLLVKLDHQTQDSIVQGEDSASFEAHPSKQNHTQLSVTGGTLFTANPGLQEFPTTSLQSQLSESVEDPDGHCESDSNDRRDPPLSQVPDGHRDLREHVVLSASPRLNNPGGQCQSEEGGGDVLLSPGSSIPPPSKGSPDSIHPRVSRSFLRGKGHDGESGDVLSLGDPCQAGQNIPLFQQVSRPTDLSAHTMGQSLGSTMF